MKRESARKREQKLHREGRGRTGGMQAEKFAAGDLTTRIPQSVDHSRRGLSQCIMGKIQSPRNHVLLHEKLISGGPDLSLA